MATLSVLINRTQELLSLAGGIGVQTYAQPKIVQYLQMGYTSLSQMRFWDDYTYTNTYTLDGTTGKVTEDLTNIIKSFKDIQYIWIDNHSSALPRAPNNRNPADMTFTCFAASGDARCPFKILPITSSGIITVRYRTAAVLPFTETSEIPIDEELLVRWAVMMYLSNDAANPTMIQTVTALYKERLDTLERLEMQHSKSLYPARSNVLTDWYDA